VIIPRASGQGGRRRAAKSVCKGDKAGKIVELLSRPSGTTLDAMMRATGWQAHSVRGFISGVVRKKMKIEVLSEKPEKGARVYRIKSRPQPPALFRHVRGLNKEQIARARPGLSATTPLNPSRTVRSERFDAT
jgi:hypothetical protein